MNLLIAKCLEKTSLTVTEGLRMTRPESITTNNPALIGRRELLVDRFGR